MATPHRLAADRVTDPSRADGGPSHAPEPARPEAFARLFREGHRFDFFQAVHLLERRFADAPAPGTTTAYRQERIRFRPDPSLVFPPTDVRSIETVEENSQPHACLTATFMGLYGIDSPLPYYFYNELATGEEDTFALRDFLDLFNHRLYAFFYQAWKKYRPALHHRPPARRAHTRRFLTLAGLGTPGALTEQNEEPVSQTRLAAFVGRLVSRWRNAEGLRALLRGFFEGLPVRIVENVPRWVRIRRRPAVGGAMRLGRNATVGERVYDRSSCFRIVLGPMGLDTYRSLLPGGAGARRLQWLVRSYAPDHLDLEVELRLAASQAPAAALGDGAQLGLTTFLGASTHAEITRIVHYS